jgi:ATP-dependent HslUV protease ATP-binding subunit HslU
VELTSLSKDDFVRILKEPENALIAQYKALLETEEVELIFDQEAIDELEEIAYQVNSRTENIGARRLHTVMEKLLSDVSFNAPNLKGQSVHINRDYVRNVLSEIIKDEDLSRYIL